METAKKLWNRNFKILWQGQFISDFGNALFSVALGFWVLAVTKSTALMGAILACFAVPRVLIGPFAGALADRLSRKWLIVSADFARGALYTLMGLTVFFKVFPFAAIYPLAILAGSCDAFFEPALSSAIPDVVPGEELSKANAARSVSTTVTQLTGNSLGGVLFALLSAPVMILLNGVSFLYAAVTQLFMKIPFTNAAAQKKSFMRDLAGGIKYTFGRKGLRTLMITCAALNFFAVVGLTLLTPLFNSTPGFGVRMYGYMMGVFTLGAVLGMVVLSAVKIKASQRSALVGFATVAMVLAMIPIGFIYNVWWLFPLAFAAGVCNAIVNMTIQTIMQATTPAESRGKVFGILGTVSGALMPLAMAVSGVVAQFAGVRPTIVVSFVLLAVSVLPLLLDRHFKEFINTDISAEREDSRESLGNAEETAA